MAKISCVMPTKNRADLLGESIQSIVDQSETDWELIIVDDHSDNPNDSRSIVDGLGDARIRFVELDRNGLGVACARNLGNMLASADIIAVMDSDDIAYPERFEQTLKKFDATHADVVYGEIDWWRPETSEVWQRDGKHKSRPFDLQAFQELNYIPNVTSAFKKQLAMDFPYNSFFRRGEDWDFFLRLARHKYQFAFIPLSLVKVRRHDNSIITQKLEEYSYDEMVKLNNKNYSEK